MNKVNEKINVLEAGCRILYDVKELHNAILRTGGIRMSWGFNNACTIPNKNNEVIAYRFKVQGHHHKGYVYLFVNGMDLFDIYYTSTHKNIKKIKTDIYIDELIDILDTDIERIPEYTS